MVETKFVHTDIGLIPEDWEIISLQENFKLKARIGWQGLTTSEYRKYGEYYLITGTDFKNGFIDWNNCVFVDKLRYDQDKNIQIRAKDVLITKDGTIGKVAYVDKVNKPTTLNSGVFVLRATNNQMNSKFIYYILMSFYFDNFLKKITAGSTITHLYQKDFIHFNFVLPPFLEQQAIAEILSDTDDWIENLEKTVTKKQLIKQGAMQKLLAPTENWEVKKLGEICEIIMGQSPLSKFYNQKGIGLPLIQGNADIEHRRTIVRNFTSQITKKGNTGDIIMSVRAPVGEIAKATFDCCLGRGVCALRYSNDFLYHYLVFAENKWHTFSTGSTFDSVNSNQIIEFEINIPKSLSEQAHIATILSDMDDEIKVLEQKLTKAKQIKQSLMQELLTGRIRLV